MPYYSELGIYTTPSSTYSTGYLKGPYSNHSSILASNILPLSSKSLHRSNFRPFKPHLTTIRETSANSPLRRINSPKLLYHTSPKVRIQRPLKINTADIDVSANKYRKYDLPPRAKPTVATESQEQSSPSSSSPKSFSPRNSLEEKEAKPNTNIRRDRATVRLQTIHKDTLTKELGEIKSWRDNFKPEELVTEAKVRRKTPGEILKEKFLIRSKSKENVSTTLLETPVVTRKKSVIRKSPSFKDICDVITSDTVDDDLNPGQPVEIKRRQSRQYSNKGLIKEIRRTSSTLSAEDVEILDVLLSAQENLAITEKKDKDRDNVKKKKIVKKKALEKLPTTGDKNLEDIAKGMDNTNVKKEISKDIKQSAVNTKLFVDKDEIVLSVKPEPINSIKTFNDKKIKTTNLEEEIDKYKENSENKEEIKEVGELNKSKPSVIDKSENIINVSSIPMAKYQETSNKLIPKNSKTKTLSEDEEIQYNQSVPDPEPKSSDIKDISQVEIESIPIKPKPVITSSIGQIEEKVKPNLKLVVDNVNVEEIPLPKKEKKFRFNVVVEEIEEKRESVKSLPKNKLIKPEMGIVQIPVAENPIISSILKKKSQIHVTKVLPEIIEVKHVKQNCAPVHKIESAHFKNKTRSLDDKNNDCSKTNLDSANTNILTNNNSWQNYKNMGGSKNSSVDTEKSASDAQAKKLTSNNKCVKTVLKRVKLSEQPVSKIQVEDVSLVTKSKTAEISYVEPTKQIARDENHNDIEETEEETKRRLISKRSLIQKANKDDPDLEVFVAPQPPTPEEPEPEETPAFVPLQSNRLSAWMHPWKKPEQMEDCPIEIYAKPKFIRCRHVPRRWRTAEYYKLQQELQSDSESSDSSDEDDSSANEDSSADEEVCSETEERVKIGASTSSNDSGFDSGRAQCDRVKDSLDSRDSPSSNPALNPAFSLDSNDVPEEYSTSSTYASFQKSGRITPPATTIPRFRKYCVEDFNFLKVLGKGSFGKVLLAELKGTEYYYAIKCLKKDVVLEDDDVECTLIERKVLALGTKHPYLCHLLCTFQTESHLFFVMEYLNGGDLMFHIQMERRFSEARARFYGAEIVSGLKFLHNKGIVYRDLKLDNILLDFDGHVRIADFGMCKLQIFLDRMADTFCGTPDYMAPEIIKGLHYNQCVDWWSFGVLLYEMLLGQSPFSGCDEDELFWSICNEKPVIPKFLSAEANLALTQFLDKDGNKRLGNRFSPYGDIQDHVFFKPIDWVALEARQLESPFKPNLLHPLDTQYFDKTFTVERAKLTPIETTILQSIDQTQFQGFSYTNPNATDK